MSARPREVAAREADRARLSVVRARSGRSLIQRGKARRIAPLALVGTIAVVAILFFVLLEQVVLAQSAFKLARLRDRLEAAEARRSELAFQVAKLESPARIEAYARDRLGMIDPQPGELRYIVADVSSGLDRHGAAVASSRTVGVAAPDAAATMLNEAAP